MKRINYILFVALLAMTACGNAPKEEEPVEEPKEAVASSEDLMNAYVDSINVLADSLGSCYHTIMDDAARNLDSAKANIEAYRAKANPLKSELNRMSEEVNRLLNEKKINEEDYQTMFHEIRLNAVEASAQTLDVIGIRLQAEADSLRNE
ncbi:MAG: hypothetical protein GC180_01985 [Bacteroidetes bacterium]|nr:hypothetical protein [Bacteroidota bacterium]